MSAVAHTRQLAGLHCEGGPPHHAHADSSLLAPGWPSRTHTLPVGATERQDHGGWPRRRQLHVACLRLCHHHLQVHVFAERVVVCVCKVQGLVSMDDVVSGQAQSQTGRPATTQQLTHNTPAAVARFIPCAAG